MHAANENNRPAAAKHEREMKMKAACEMTTAEYIEAIGGRSEAADSAICFDSAQASRFWLVTEIARHGDYVIGRTREGELHAFVAEAAAADDETRSVGYFKYEARQTTLAVDGDHSGRGLGLELMWNFRKNNPLQNSGGLSAGGYALACKCHARLVAAQL